MTLDKSVEAAVTVKVKAIEKMIAENMVGGTDDFPVLNVAAFLGDLVDALSSEDKPEVVAAPEGWRLVPEYPDDTMMQAGLYQSSHDAEWADVFQSYVDMVRVAPTAPNSPSIPEGKAEPGEAAVIERCAKVAEEIGKAYGEDETGWLDCSETIAKQIRALSTPVQP